MRTSYSSLEDQGWTFSLEELCPELLLSQEAPYSLKHGNSRVKTHSKICWSKLMTVWFTRAFITYKHNLKEDHNTNKIVLLWGTVLCLYPRLDLNSLSVPGWPWIYQCFALSLSSTEITGNELACQDYELTSKILGTTYWIDLPISANTNPM